MKQKIDQSILTLFKKSKKTELIRSSTIIAKNERDKKAEALSKMIAVNDDAE